MHGNVAEFTRGFVTPSYADVEFAPGDGAIVTSRLSTRRIRRDSRSRRRRPRPARAPTRMQVGKVSQGFGDRALL